MTSNEERCTMESNSTLEREKQTWVYILTPRFVGSATLNSFLIYKMQTVQGYGEVYMR